MGSQSSPPSGLQLTFHGAAGTVTGSCYELVWRGRRYVIDCGMFQGTRSLESLNAEPTGFDPAAVDAVILTHAHLDHSGRLPMLYAQGCTAPLYCTRPTADIIDPLLVDAAKLQAHDVERRNRRHDRRGLPAHAPLTTPEDVARCVGRVRTIDYCQWVDLGDDAGFRFWDARHIIGAASVELRLGDMRLLFSGDVGSGRPIVCHGQALGGYDHIICESTYGNRTREPELLTDRREALARHIEGTLVGGGNLMIAAFAVERTQAVLEDLVALFESGRLEPVSVFVDTPLGEAVTRATFKHRQSGLNPFAHRNIHFVESVEESRRLANVKGAVIIAGSGMCTGGRIRFHLIEFLPDPASQLLLVGYQVSGTLGAVLQGGARHVRISGENVPVRARIESMGSYSCHADRPALNAWIGARLPLAGSLFLTHGEHDALETLAGDTRALLGGRSANIPRLGSRWELRAGAAARELSPGRDDADVLVAPRDRFNALAAIKSAEPARTGGAVRAPRSNIFETHERGAL